MFFCWLAEGMSCEKLRWETELGFPESELVLVVTGSSGRLGEALCDRLLELYPDCHGIYGIDFRSEGRWSGCLPDAESVERLVKSRLDRPGLRVVVFHCGALHKPQVKTHPESAFVAGNIGCTLALLEALESLEQARVDAFVYTSTTSVLAGQLERGSCLWLDNSSAADPKNVYGWSKLAAEGLCRLHSRRFGVVCLRACRFFPEADDREAIPGAVEIEDEDNLKLLDTLIGRRLTLRDVVEAHLAGWRLARRRGEGYQCFMLANRVLLTRDDILGLQHDAATTVALRYPGLGEALGMRGWSLFTHPVDRVYDASHTFETLGWEPIDTPCQFIQALIHNHSFPEW